MKTIRELNSEFSKKDPVLKVIYCLAIAVLLGLFVNTLINDVLARENDTSIDTVNVAAVEEVVNEGGLFKLQKSKHYKYEYNGDKLSKVTFMSSIANGRDLEFNVTEDEATLEEINNDYENIKYSLSNKEYAFTVGEKALVIPLVFCVYALIFTLIVLMEPTLIKVIEFVRSHRSVEVA